MPEPLVINSWLSIPDSELRFTFARSSGPGGQNVNKVNTKAVLRWGVTRSAALPQAIRDRLLARYGARITGAGEIVIASDRYREQARNVAECRERLRQMVLTVATPPRRRKPTRVPRSAKETRLKQKRRHSLKKQSRRPPSDE